MRQPEANCDPPFGTVRYAVPDNIAWVDGSDFGRSDELYLTKVPSGESVLLTGSARVIWLAAPASGDSLDELAWPLPPVARVRLHSFAATLAEQGLISLEQR